MTLAGESPSVKIRYETLFWKTGNHGLLPLFAALGRVFAMNEITRILSAIEQGDPRAAEELLPLVYTELRRLAAQRLSREAPGQTLQATALVHEAYLRLVSGDEYPGWNGRGHFFAAAAEAMRRILIERARRVQTLRRGGDRNRLDLDQADLAAPNVPRTCWHSTKLLINWRSKMPGKPS